MYKTSLWEMWTIFVWMKTVTSKYCEHCYKVILFNFQLYAFFQCIYFTSVHVSSNPVLIIR